MCLFVIPFGYVLWTGRGNRGVYLAWCLWFVFLTMHALCLPALVRAHELAYGETPDADPDLALYGAGAAALLGWLPGGLMSAAALGVRRVWQFIRGRPPGANGRDAVIEKIG
jgi:hypothetical protein